MNEAVFKTTVMGGFNKSDVLAFIDKQDKQFKEREKDLVTRVDGLSAGLKNETLRSEQLTKRVSELEGLLENEKKKNSEAVRKLQEANITVAQIKSEMTGEIESRNVQLDKMRLDACELTRKMNEAETASADAASRADALEAKLNLIDKTQDQIGRAMLESQQTADKIVNSAKEEAAQITKNARDEAESLLAQAKENVKNLNADAQEKLDVLLRQVADYEKRVSESRADTAEFFRAVDSVFTSMQNNAGDILTRFTNAFEPDDETADNNTLDTYDYAADADNGVSAETGEAQAASDESGFSQPDESSFGSVSGDASAVKFDFSNKDNTAY